MIPSTPPENHINFVATFFTKWSAHQLQKPQKAHSGSFPANHFLIPAGCYGYDCYSCYALAMIVVPWTPETENPAIADRVYRVPVRYRPSNGNTNHMPVWSVVSRKSRQVGVIKTGGIEKVGTLVSRHVGLDPAYSNKTLWTPAFARATE